MTSTGAVKTGDVVDGAPNGQWGRSAALVAVAVILAGVVPVTLVGQIEDVGRSDAWIFTLSIIVWGGIRLAWLIVSGAPRLFDFFFWMFCYIFMGIAPTVQIRSGVTSRTTPGIDEGLYVPTALLVCAGLLTYEVFRAVWIGRERRRATGERSGLVEGGEVIAQVDRSRTLLLVGFGLLASAYFLASVGPAALLGSREASFDARNAAWPDPAVRSIMYALAIYPLLVGAGALAQLRRGARGLPIARWYLAGLVACVVVLLLIVNPVGSARYTFGTVAFALICYAGAMLTPQRVRIALAGTLGAFLFLFPLADAFRSDEVNLTRNGFFGEYMGNPDYDAFWQVANGFSFWVDGLVIPLRQILGSALFWVPRSLWADKPTDTGILLAQYRGYSFDNLSAPLWAELLVNGGLIALIVGFALVGIGLRFMDTRLLLSFASGGLWSIVGAIFPVYMTILMRGSLLQATGAMAVAVACVLVIRSRPSRPGAAQLE
ncbi:hypothetical protein [Mycetocola manganoxydans]|nr:hypothetical protein [Mycetocola manganoxydans]